MTPPPEALRNELAELRADVVARAEADEAAGRLEGVDPAFRESARNLLRYLALRQRDLRPLQRRLAALGLSSLGRAEAHVLATLDATLGAVDALAGRPWRRSETAADFETGPRRLAAHAEAVLGPEPPGRDVRVMVTLPSEAADDGALVCDLVARGMNVARINCAHDDAQAWTRMVEHVREAERAVDRPCRVLMDLAGPKLRTGPVEPGPCVTKVRPERDALGLVVAPARVWLSAGAPPPVPAAPSLPVPTEWLADVRGGDRLRFTDARGSRRRLRAAEAGPGGRWAESWKTAYVVPGTRLQRPDGARASVGDLPAREGRIRVETGDVLLLTRDAAPGRPAERDAEGAVKAPARIGCTLPEVLDDVRPGEPVGFDDGRMAGVVESVASDHARVRITRCRPGGRWLRADKGINLPESALRLDALTPKDLADLPFVARHADAVGLSFAGRPSDVDALRQRLAALTDTPPAVVVKVETRRAFAGLPGLLLAAMRAPACGVMIARGDLAVECGFERMAEVQEEILWVCEAAHVPVVWATQVLESLAKDGTPSRAEVTDAAMGHRAECVMLNKGPHVLGAVEALDDILRRMGGHQTKKHAELRALALAGHNDASPRATSTIATMAP